MKNLLTATLPALALLALGGCATTSGLTTTEDDGVYYSSADKTVAAPAPAYTYTSAASNRPSAFQPGTATPDGTLAPTDDANPDYTGDDYDASALASRADYYSNRYSTNPSAFGVPYTGPGVSSYDYSPAVTASPYSYYSPYSFYSPYSMPVAYGFYSPWSYDLGLSFGFGAAWGYPFGSFYGPYSYSSFYSPWGLGYGYPVAYYGSYGYAGRGYRAYSNSASGFYGDQRSSASYGPRNRRGGMVLNAQPTSAAAGSNAPVSVGGGRRGGFVMAASPTSATPQGSSSAVGQPTTATPNAGAMPAASSRRGGFFNGFFGNGASSQPQGNSSYTPQNNPQRSFSQPSFSQPNRSFSQPSFSQPSHSMGGGGGGGSFGGGGGGGGGRRGGR